jgi:hypothetical protein
MQTNNANEEGISERAWIELESFLQQGFACFPGKGYRCADRRLGAGYDNPSC